MDTRNSDRRTSTTSTREVSDVTKSTYAKIAYLNEIIDESINIYDPIRKTKNAVNSILNYYGFTEDVDYEILFRNSDYGTKSLVIRWYWDTGFHNESWDTDDKDNWDIYSEFCVAEY